jgi:outer membrane protein assembly factor BamB
VAPLFPLTPVWEATLEDQVVAPLGADARRVFVATRDGAVTAFSRRGGGADWRVEATPGRLTVAPGRVIVRGADGTVRSLRPRTGEERWKTETGIAGDLPVTLDGDRLYVAGSGVAALEVESGRILWTQPTLAPITSPPVAATARVLVGDVDGNLHSLDRAGGVTLWTSQTGGTVKAPPLVDEERRRVYVGTTAKRILEVKLDDGKKGWRWKVGADVESPGLLLPDRVFFASFDAILWGLNRGGSLAWRTPLPSRPLSGPLIVGEHILIACHEDEILGFNLRSGDSSGSLRTVAEIRTPPVVSEGQLFVALRNRTLASFALPAPAGPAPPAE